MGIKTMREQLKFYENKGFHVVEMERRAGSHWLVRFAEFPEAQILTQSKCDPRAWLNNVAHYRRLKEKHSGTNT
jgi:hypothetical protein